VWRRLVDTTEIKGKIIGRTLIQDYVFRPAEYSQMSLYDWIRLSHVEKRPKKYEQNSFDDDINGADSEDENDKVTFHHFLKDHPLYQLTPCDTNWTICKNGFQILWWCNSKKGSWR